MAKKKSSRRRRTRMKGLGFLGKQGGALGATGALVLTGATTLGLRAFLRPEPGAMSEKLYMWAPMLGAGAGVLGAIGFGMMGKGAKAKESAYTAAIVSIAAGGLLFASERLNAAKPGATAALGQGMTVASGGTTGMGAILPEYAPEHDGLGAIVMEPLKGAYGESVNVAGLGAGYNPAAFGTAPF